MKLKLLLPLLAVLGAFLLSGCEHSFPLTAEPTGPVDGRLVGDWVTRDNEKSLLVIVRRYDNQHLAFSYDGQLYRAWPSEVGHQPYLTLQVLGEEKHPYVFARYQIEDGGKKLHFQIVQHAVVPETTATSAAAQEILLKQPAPSAEEAAKNSLVLVKVSDESK